jgi:hypothetical protein
MNLPNFKIHNTVIVGRHVAWVRLEEDKIYVCRASDRAPVVRPEAGEFRAQFAAEAGRGFARFGDKLLNYDHISQVTFGTECVAVTCGRHTFHLENGDDGVRVFRDDWDEGRRL